MPLSLDIKTFSLSTSIVTAAVLFTAGCDGASPDAQPDEQAVAPTLLDTPSLFCGEYEFTDDETGATIFRPEVYYPIALKNSLKIQLRSTDDEAGSTEVELATSCEAARDQHGELAALLAAAPAEDIFGELKDGFDVIGQPAEFDLDDDASRLWNGATASSYLTPVVYINFVAGSGYACTGSIISKRHILTSAHCAPGAGPHFIYFEAVAGLSWGTSTATTYIHPNFVGGHQSTPLSPSYDLAIIEVPTSAAIISHMSSSSNRFRFYSGNTVVGTDLRLRGMGHRDNSGTNTPSPGVADQPVNDLNVNLAAHSGGYFRGFTSSSLRACAGDSGGPSIEKGMYSRPIAWGAFSGYSSSGAGAYCPSGSGKTMWWAKTNVAASWIESSMKPVFGSSFKCKVYGSSGRTYRRCW